MMCYSQRDLQGSFWLHALHTCASQGVVSNRFGYHTLLHRCLDDQLGLLRLLALFTCADQGIVGDCIGHHTLMHQFLKSLLGKLRLLALPTGNQTL